MQSDDKFIDDKLIDLEPHKWTSDREKPREPFWGPDAPAMLGYLIGFIIQLMVGCVICYIIFYLFFQLQPQLNDPLGIWKREQSQWQPQLNDPYDPLGIRKREKNAVVEQSQSQPKPQPKPNDPLGIR
ncbi:MAG TPA: hypothetical protein VNL39_14975 [Xanthobacteraceae bacterium]|nr:hypothetical protein [Xanthobacteraceae bacterium]